MGSDAGDSQRIVLPAGARTEGGPPGRLTENQLKLARVLLSAGPLTQDHVQQQLERSGKADSSVGKALLASGYPSEAALVYPLLARYRIPRLNVANVRIIPEVRDLIPAEVARRLQVLPIDRVGDILVVATPDIFNAFAVEELRQLVRSRISVVQTDEVGLAQALQKYYPEAPRVTASRRPGVPHATLVAEFRGRRPGPTVLRALPAEAVGRARAVQGRFLDVDARFRRVFESAGPVPVEEVLM